jgi:thiol-disulfide isomerase/thioredoxin
MLQSPGVLAMKCAVMAVLLCGFAGVAAWPQSAETALNPKAQKTYAQAQEWLQHRNLEAALDGFKKANKQDDGHCKECQFQIIKLGLETGDFKSADAAAQDEITEAKDAQAAAMAHDQRGMVLVREGMAKNKAEVFAQADSEYKAALSAYHNFPDAMYGDGLALARLNQDSAAKAEFEAYLDAVKGESPQRQRAQRFAARPELARARMAPPFSIRTMDGKTVSLDGLAGKVVLNDFWATWCGPCREALPHVRQIAQKFQGQPLVVLSISLDDDEAKWKDFVAKNNMTWLQYRDGGFTGSIARMFAVNAIPHTFTIDPDGVLQDEHIGDADI